jgi:hypothetical protein
MIRWTGIDRAPRSLRVYAGLTLVYPFVVIAKQQARESAMVWLGVALMLLLLVSVLRGSKVAWWVATAWLTLIVISTLLSPPIIWWAFVINLASLAYLLAPESRRYCCIGVRPVV